MYFKITQGLSVRKSIGSQKYSRLIYYVNNKSAREQIRIDPIFAIFHPRASFTKFNSHFVRILIKKKKRKNLPKMYIMVKQLSKAKPKKNLQMANSRKLLENTVATPETKPTMFDPTSAGMRP